MSDGFTIIRGSGNVFRDLDHPDADGNSFVPCLRPRSLACWTSAS
jgi:hypothetical protein